MTEHYHYYREFLKEICWIEDEHIRYIVKKTLNEAPGYFWTCPASSTGKHHPLDERGGYGTVIHVHKAVKVSEDLCRACGVTGLPRDYVIAATLLHDICKNGYPDSCGHMVTGHGFLIAQVMKDAKIFDPDEPDENCVKILDIAAGHMGRWDAPFFPKCDGSLSFLVHIADYIVSREYISVGY